MHSPRLFSRRFVASALLALPIAYASAQGVLYYDPQGTNTTDTGGTGTLSNSPWYTGTGTDHVVWNNTHTELHFGGTGQVAPYTITTALTNMTITGTSDALRTLSFFFHGDYIYTKNTGQTNTSTIGGSGNYAYLTISVDAGKTVSYVAGTDTEGVNRISLQSYGNSSINSSVTITGSGTVNLGQNIDVIQGSTNGHIRIGGANATPTVNANAGSTMTGSRLQLASGTLNINGSAASFIGGTSSRSNNAIIIGGNGTASEGHTAATINLNSGSLTAVPGSPNEYGLGQGQHGLAFAINPESSSTTTTPASIHNTRVGGTFNLNGGTFTTTDIYSNIYANTDTVTARFVFNGGTLVVSPAATQAHLDGFITGFKDTDLNHVAIAAGGATIDTGEIDTGTTNGVATIVSVIRGEGSLTKIGANTLLLNAANTYAGATVISAGTLALGATGSIANSSSISIADGATLDATAGLLRVSTGQDIQVSGSGLFTGAIAFGSDTTADDISFSGNFNVAAGSTFIFDIGAGSDLLSVGNDLVFNGPTVFDFNVIDSISLGLYTLVIANSITGADQISADFGALPTGYMYDLISSGNTLQLSVAAIPEPAAVAALAGLAALGFSWRRRRTAR